MTKSRTDETMDKYGKYCLVLNFLTWIAVFVLLSIPVWILIENLIIKIIVCIILFFPCGFFEERVLSRHVNQFVEHVLKIND